MIPPTVPQEATTAAGSIPVIIAAISVTRESRVTESFAPKTIWSRASRKRLRALSILPRSATFSSCSRCALTVSARSRSIERWTCFELEVPHA